MNRFSVLLPVDLIKLCSKSENLHLRTESYPFMVDYYLDKSGNYETAEVNQLLTKAVKDFLKLLKETEEDKTMPNKIFDFFKEIGQKMTESNMKIGLRISILKRVRVYRNFKTPKE